MKRNGVVAHVKRNRSRILKVTLPIFLFLVVGFWILQPYCAALSFTPSSIEDKYVKVVEDKDSKVWQPLLDRLWREHDKDRLLTLLDIARSSDKVDVMDYIFSLGFDPCQEGIPRKYPDFVDEGAKGTDRLSLEMIKNGCR